MTIIVHPQDPSKTCDLSKRGRRPNWYYEFFEKDDSVISLVKEVQMVKEKIEQSGLSYWRWVGVRDADEEDFLSKRTSSEVPRIYVAANNSSEAIHTLNKTFRNAVSQLEFTNCWKRVEPNEFMIKTVPGVWQFVNGVWESRKILT